MNKILDSLSVDNLVLNSATPIADHPVAITDYLFEFSESAVANIDFTGEPISGVTLDPANASIDINGLYPVCDIIPKFIMLLLFIAQFLSLDLWTPITLWTRVIVM